MMQYKKLTLDDVRKLTIDDMIKKYNESIEEIWYLNYEIQKFCEEVNIWQEAYEKVRNKLYG